MITLGITGTIGAGKGTVVDFLVKEKGFKHYSARAFLLKEVAKRGLAPVRDNTLLVANDLRKTYFPGYIIAELLKEAQKNKQDAVIESIRSVGEIEVLRKSADKFFLIGVDADPRKRYERVIKRRSSTDNVTFEKFREDEEKETNTKEPWSANLSACIKQADVVFENNGDIAELHQKVANFLSKIGI